VWGCAYKRGRVFSDTLPLPRRKRGETATDIVRVAFVDGMSCTLLLYCKHFLLHISVFLLLLPRHHMIASAELHVFNLGVAPPQSF